MCPPLLQSAYQELHWLYESCGDWEAVLREGIVVGPTVDGDVASAGVTFARAETLDDIGVALCAGLGRRSAAAALS